MENVLPAIVAFAIMLVSSVTMVTTADRSIDSLATSWKAMAESADRRHSSRLESSGSAVDFAGTGVTIDVVNAGGTAIMFFDRMDVIVEYTTTLGVREIVSLEYVAAVPAADQWTVTAISPDAYDPRIVNPGETMELSLRLANALEVGAINRATIAVPSGAAVSVSFTR
ncbi:MAG: hypothetical protein R3B97_12190 [Dehalococcoidia bacterium]|nr:hypothetical protein [Dehalococcoidia bacterium]MCB9484709.1 hypothetical protein [Thermoflexaceae bacterium]